MASHPAAEGDGRLKARPGRGDVRLYDGGAVPSGREVLDDAGGVNDEEAAGRPMRGRAEGEEAPRGDPRVDDYGKEMSAFHLDDEREDGFFNEDGNFVWRKDPSAADAWLETIKDEDAEAAAAAAEERRALEERASGQEDMMAEDEALDRCIAVVAAGETVQKALIRLGRSKDAAERERFERLSEAADALLGRGRLDVYGAKRETLGGWLREVRGGPTAEAEAPSRKRPRNSYFAKPAAGAAAAAAVAAAAATPPDKVFWEYVGEDGEVHGPFGTSQIVQWRAQGYFKSTKMRVVRDERERSAPKSLAQDMLDDLDDDGDGGVEESKGADGDGGGGGGDAAEWRAADLIDFAAFQLA